MLMHHSYAVRNRLLARGHFKLLPIQIDLPRGHILKPIKHFHQGALACSVFPYKGMDLSLVYGKVYVVVGKDASFINLRHIFDFKQMSHL